MMRASDLAIIGVGIAGAATAYYFTKAGMALFDAERPGWGASGRNPGFLWLQTPPAIDPAPLSYARFASAPGGGRQGPVR